MKKTADLQGKTVLITGGTGSFGRAFVQMLLEEEQCKKIIILSRDEWKQWEMRNSAPLFDHPSLRYFLGDIRDSNRLMRAFREVDYVIHAAALKQVPAAEYNPTEFVKTNILGTKNVIDAALACEVKKVVFLSTDKAVSPTNLYGATKLCAEKFTIAANSYVGASQYPRFSVVRYGNVAGTRGSVLPLWASMLSKGAKSIPLTNKEMTRFWITLEQSVAFVKQALGLMYGGEILVPKIPSVKITDLAQALSPKTPIEEKGIRAGEKLHELLISVDEARHTLELPTHYAILPEMYSNTPHFTGPLEAQRKNPLPPSFAYSSDNNSDWLSTEQLQTFITTQFTP